MRTRTLPLVVLLFAAVACGLTASLAGLPDGAASGQILASWGESASKHAIMEFVGRVTQQGGPNYVPPAERVAAFDDDGTLWAEQPMPVQFAFVLDQVRALSPRHPEWSTREPFASMLRGDIKDALAGGQLTFFQILTAIRAGMTTEDFDAVARDWIATAKHPKTGRLYTETAYQPMRELLEYLAANDFRILILSEGSIDFVRIFAERVYGVSPEQVVGSAREMTFTRNVGAPAVAKLLYHIFVEKKYDRLVDSPAQIRPRPIAAFGNADGDIQMLQQATSGGGARLGFIVHHTDAEREWAYDTSAATGKLDNGLDQAQANEWAIVDMKTDWKVIFLFEKR